MMRRFIVTLGLSLGSLGIADAATTVRIVGSDFWIDGAVTYPGAPAQGKLLNVRMTNPNRKINQAARR